MQQSWQFNKSVWDLNKQQKLQNSCFSKIHQTKYSKQMTLMMFLSQNRDAGSKSNDWHNSQLAVVLAKSVYLHVIQVIWDTMSHAIKLCVSDIPKSNCTAYAKVDGYEM